MSRIDGLSSGSAVHKTVNLPASRSVSAEPAQNPPSLPPADRLEISSLSHFLSVLKSQNGVRADLVASVRKQIENGTYETSEKIDSAVNGLMDDLGL